MRPASSGGRAAVGWFVVASVLLAGLHAQSPSSDWDARRSEATSRLQRGDRAGAIEILSDLVRSRPDDADTQLALGLALSQVLRRSEAIEALLRAIELRPGHARSLLAAGSGFANLGEQDAALSAFQRAADLEPDLGPAHLSIAIILASKEEFDQALEHMAVAIRLEKDPNRQAHLLFLNAKLHAERERLLEAEADLQRSVELNAENGEALLALGLVRTRLLREDEALPLFERAVQIIPENPQARYQLALAKRRDGDLGSAVEHLQAAHEMRPNEQSILYNLMRVLHMAGRTEDASRQRQKLQRMIATLDNARENELATAKLHEVGLQMQEGGDLVGAVDKFRTVLEFEPFNNNARRDLGLVLCRLDRCDEGVAELEAILRDDPDDVTTQRALAMALDQSQASESGASDQ